MSVRIGMDSNKRYATCGMEGPKFYFEKGNSQEKANAIGKAYEWYQSECCKTEEDNPDSTLYK